MPRYTFENDDDMFDPILGQQPVQRKRIGATASWAEPEAVEPTAPVSAPIKATRPVSKPIESATEPKPVERIPEPVLQKLEAEKPELVARYRAKMAEADQGVKDAERDQEIGSYLNIAGKLANDYANSQKDDVIYKNSWSKMGNAPQIDRAERKEYDGSAIDKLGQQKVASAKANKQQAEDEFMTAEKLTDLEQSRMDQADAKQKAQRLADPKSAESQAARERLKLLAPNSVKGMNIEGFSANDVEKISPQIFQDSQRRLNQEFQAGENQKNRNHQDSLAKQKADAKSGGATDGIKALDKDYAKDYNDYTSKGRVNAVASINRLKEIQKQLEAESKSIVQAGGGPISGSLPDWARTQQSISLRDNARNAANATLKSLFGGQLSDGERKAAASEFYNDSLDAEMNAKLLADKIQQMEQGLAEEDAKAQHFQRYKTLDNYRGNQANQTQGAGATGSFDWDAEDKRRGLK